MHCELENSNLSIKIYAYLLYGKGSLEIEPSRAMKQTFYIHLNRTYWDIFLFSALG